ncbi:MAG: UDP-glucose 4-epimerase GalE [Bacteroidia bacterium]
MKILVTGGTGYIGSHTVVELQQAGYEVVIIDNLENSSPMVVDQVEKITGIRPHFEITDIRDKQALESIFTMYSDIKHVVHFAAYKAVGESVQFPLKYYENNVGGLINLLELIQKHHILNFIFSSSCTVYGEVDQLPVTEDTPVVKARSPYGNTKKICEEILMDHSKVSNLRVVSLRYFNPVGAHDSALIGELPLGIPNNLVPFITQTAIGKRDILTVFGNDYSTPDGTCIRDYIHVVDLAKAHVKAIEFLKKEKQKENFSVFNIGTGRGNSVLEVINSFKKVSGEKLKYKIGERRPGDVVQVYSSCTKAEKELGWKAERTLDDCMETAWKWEQRLANVLM